MFSIILVATDGSRESLVAVRAAAKEALLHKAVLHTVCAVNPGIVKSMFVSPHANAIIVDYDRINDFQAEEANKALDYAEKEAADVGVSVIPHLMKGDPREEILRCAEEIGADCIVLGSTGKTGLKALLLGSVSSAVVTHAKISTMIIREKRKE
ncbi:MAG: universal stress protein [Methanomicrobiales archaeon]|jgi:nucleotide-binding universal stress UspA family protein|nr:universal stress protein [Methanomicrobiales archaeon]